MTERNTYARAPRGRINHLITGDLTACGLSLTGMAKWPASLMPRVDARPVCAPCREAKPARTRPGAATEPSCRCYGMDAHPVHPWWAAS